MNDEHIVREITEEIGRSAEVFGFSSIVGEIWATLYFKGEMGQDGLKKELSASLGTISQSLGILENLGLVEVVKKVGRKKVYAAEFSIHKTKRKVLENSLRFKLEPMIDLIDQRSAGVKDKDVRLKIAQLREKYSKAAAFIRLILKIPFGK